MIILSAVLGLYCFFDQLLLTNSTPRIPNVLLAGAQKSGTTYIFTHLATRADTCMARPQLFSGDSVANIKELHFFDKPERYQQGISFFQRRFRHCGNTPVIMDGTPLYINNPEQIHSFYEKHGALKDLKIVFSLREPVSREISSYNMMVTNAQSRSPPEWSTHVRDQDNGEILSFGEYAERFIIPRINDTLSWYGDKLQTWFELYDREQILVLSYDELKTNETALFERIFAFLQLPATGSGIPFHVRMQGDKSIPLPPCSIQNRLATLFEPSNTKLYSLLEANPGPEMEQRPFPRFRNRCEEKEEEGQDDHDDL